ncbi:Ctf8-domain-containing protein [Mycotypha africana]|uniref:Ctf8-domain-containing protein n=1 Tax=Mycotypha africana TaxID=64632 RepID=UPI0023014E94|nr:Ctf8-domain-containing protein [Mycotypha africana]KAI8987232.1 Ctf8-domain-containing protein [Mycotypha africana]
MVQVIIEPGKSSADQSNLIILDFQGSFDIGDQLDFRNLKIGDLNLQENSAELIIGHHRLIGKKITLAKPFAVIRKRKQVEDAMTDEETVQYDVTAIVKEKYVFSTRPGLMVQQSLRGLTKIGRK